MKILVPPFACALALSLSGCSLLGAAGSVLMTPFKLLGGMANAVSRTVSQAETPVQGADQDAITRRGSEIAGKGPFGGNGIAPPAQTEDSVARR